jgi:PAS domain S-box-containing protein
MVESITSFDPSDIELFLSRLEENIRGLPGDQQQLTAALATLRAGLLNGDGSGPARPGAGAGKEPGADQPGESEMRLRLAMGAAHLATWDFDVATQVATISEPLAEYLGVPPGQLSLGEHEFSELVPEDLPFLRMAYAAALHDNVPFDLEVRVVPRGQSQQRWMHAWAMVERDGCGASRRLVGVTMDVTESRQAEAELFELGLRERARAAELKALMDAVPAIIWIARDAGCSEITGNRAGYQFLEMSQSANLSKTSGQPEEIQVLPYKEFRHGRPIPPHELPMQVSAATGQEIKDYEFDLVFKNGVTKNIFGNVVPLLDGEARPAGAVGAFVDITQRREAEKALARSQAQLAKLFSTSIEGIWAVDQDGTTTFVNQRAAEILGYNVEEIEGKNAFDFLMGEDVEAGRQTLTAIAAGKSGHLEAHARHKDGREVWLQVSFSPLLGAGGEFEGALAMFTDVTERKQARDLLAQRETELSEAQRIAHIGSWLWQQDTDTVLASDETLRIFGIDPEGEGVPAWQQLKGHFHPAEAWDRINSAGREALDSGSPFEMDVPAMKGDQQIWVVVRAEALCDAEGEITGLRGTVQDITQRKQSEQEKLQLALSERARANELQALMDAVPALIWIARDPECKTMTGNRYGYEFLRMWEGGNISKTAAEDELKGQPYRNFRDGREIPAEDLPMQVAARTGEGTKDYEFDLVFDDGEVKNILGNAVPLIDAQGRPSGAVAAFVDITQRKQMEEQLRQSREQFHASIESLLEAYALMSAVRESGADGKPGKIVDFRFEYINEAACRITRRSREEMLGHQLLELLPDHKHNGLFDRYVRVVESGEPLVEEALVYNSGHGRRARSWAFDIHAARFGDGMVVTWDDVTERLRIKSEREHALNQMEIHERLKEQAERDRQNYAREIHDGPVQTLHATQYAISFLKEGYPNAGLQVELEEVNLGIKGAIQELRQVINELRPPSVIRFGLARAIEMHALDLREQNPEITWSYRLDSGHESFNESVALVMFRIYQEGLRNVLRHAEATQVSVKYRIAKGKASLEIRDNGVGMNPKIDTNELAQNKHFGLAGIHERAESIGATVSIDSKPGRGTRLKITLPMAAAPAA